MPREHVDSREGYTLHELLAYEAEANDWGCSWDEPDDEPTSKDLEEMEEFWEEVDAVQDEIERQTRLDEDESWNAPRY